MSIPLNARAWRATKTAQSRNADVFIWWPTELIACFNAEVIQVTAQTLLRWLKLIAGWDGDMVVRRVALYSRNFLNYSRTPLEILEDADVLSPGDYGCYYRSPDFSYRRRQFEGSYNVVSLAHMESLLEQQARESSTASAIRTLHELTTSIPPAFRKEAIARNGRCVFTGTSCDDVGAGSDRSVDVHWIIPPVMKERILMMASRPVGGGAVTFWHAANLMAMRSDMQRLWYANAFSVDVHDDYRIRVFDETAVEADLPARLDNSDPRWHDYLREHFRYTLAVRIVGGHLNYEVGGDRDVPKIIYEAILLGTKPEIKVIAPQWQTVLGEEALAGVYSSEMRAHVRETGHRDGDPEAEDHD